MAVSPGSYAQARVHDKQQSNKVEMLALWEAGRVSRHLGRDLIDRNFGPQDEYPTFERPAKSALERQAEAMIEQVLMSIGYKPSRWWGARKMQIVEAADEADTLVPSLTLKAGQPLPANPSL
jgi:hypothetical protein